LGVCSGGTWGHTEICEGFGHNLKSAAGGKGLLTPLHLRSRSIHICTCCTHMHMHMHTHPHVESEKGSPKTHGEKERATQRDRESERHTENTSKSNFTRASRSGGLVRVPSGHTLGLMGLYTVFSPKFCCARIRVFQMALFPQPAGPSRKTDQRTEKISRSWLTLRQKVSSAWYPSSVAASRT
jgi:hypothetical protein